MPQAVVEVNEFGLGDYGLAIGVDEFDARVGLNNKSLSNVPVAELTPGNSEAGLIGGLPHLAKALAEQRISNTSKSSLGNRTRLASSLHVLSAGVLNTRVLQRRYHQMGLRKDSENASDDKSTIPLKSCIYIPKEDGSGERIQVKKAKSVHFADSLGKPLKSVLTMFTDDDEFEFDLSLLGLKNISTRRTFRPPADLFKSCIIIGDCKEERGRLVNFKLPVQTPHFLEHVLQQAVSVENVVFREYGVFVTVTVSNIQFEKSVFATFTFDNWTTVNKLMASYVQGSSTGKTDTFSFEIPVPGNTELDTEIQFAVSYHTSSKTFWDNNGGKNYVVLFQKKNRKAEMSSSGSEEGFLLSQHSFVGWSS